jgi:hypothetical protein
MTFLHPLLLLGLPAALLPVLIHLLNRLRFRSVKWAAMMFLISATRSSTKRARLRHYLILLSRVLAVLLFILALSRPTIGGWLGGTLAGAPDTVIILLDRSASMEATDPRRQCSKREQALKRFAQAGAEFAASSRFVLIENVLLTPQEIASPSVLSGLALTSPTDTAADVPAMFQAALDYMIGNRLGRTEIWMASDFQASNWQPERREWQRLSAQIAALPQDVRVRLLAQTEGYGRNVSVALHQVQRHASPQGQHLGLALDIRTSEPHPDAFPMIITLDGSRSQRDLVLNSQTLHDHRKLALLPDKQSGGWGKVEIPADESPRDNACYFVYGDDIPLRSVVVSDSPLSARVLRLASAPGSDLFNQSCEVVASRDASSIAWQDLAMLIWQASTPSTGLLMSIRSFVQNGGSVIYFPPERIGTAAPNTDLVEVPFGPRWGSIDTADPGKPFRVPIWEAHDGPLADTAAGLDLPLDRLALQRRRAIIPDSVTNMAWSALASFADGKPFVLRQRMDAGRLFVCTSLPHAEWSTLGEGTVLLPMLQRILRLGGERLAQAESARCGDWEPADPQEMWTSVESAEYRNALWQAGVYQCGTRRVALNRPAREDIHDVTDRDTIESLFGDVRVQILDDLSKRNGEKLQSEIWPLFLCLAMACLLAESGLLLSGRHLRDKQSVKSKTS